jgi:nicotinate-nucleotide adenylyltransferase
MKIGLYFGSFNPIHNGHLIIAKHVLNNTVMDAVWFVVSPQNPFKQNQSLLNEYHRLHLVQTAIEGETNMMAIDIEFKLPRPSYTIETLTYLAEKYPDHEFSLIMGADSLENIEKWKNGDVILKRYKICVYERLGHPIKDYPTAHIEALKAPLIEISASLIRKLIKEGKSIRYLVPDSVMNEITKSGYYK